MKSIFLYILIILWIVGCNNSSDDGFITTTTTTTTGGGSDIPVEEYFAYNVSNQAAFYFFNVVTINEIPIDNTDWVAAFKEDICVGSQQWVCQGSCEVPVYGEYSLNEDTEGYMLPGEFPSFKIYDASEDTYYDAIPSEQVPWSHGITPYIETLNAQID